MMVASVDSATAHMRSGRRPGPIGVISTIVPMPLAFASRPRRSPVQCPGTPGPRVPRVEEQVVVRVDDAELVADP